MEMALDIKMYLKFTDLLIRQYGNFKITPELHSKIIKYLAEICNDIEAIEGRKDEL